MSTSKTGAFEKDGEYWGTSSSLLAIYGKTPIAQQTAPSLVTSVNPTVSTSALVASIQSIAVYAASTVNVVVQDLIDFGIYA